MRKKLPLISGILNVLEKLKGNSGIIENTDVAVHTIAAGKYVIWKNDLYKASDAISIGDTLSLSNLTAVSDGIGNELNSNINNLIKIKSVSVTATTDSSGFFKSSISGLTAYLGIKITSGGDTSIGTFAERHSVTASNGFSVKLTGFDGSAYANKSVTATIYYI